MFFFDLRENSSFFRSMKISMDFPRIFPTNEIIRTATTSFQHIFEINRFKDCNSTSTSFIRLILLRIVDIFVANRSGELNANSNYSKSPTTVRFFDILYNVGGGGGKVTIAISLETIPTR